MDVFDAVQAAREEAGVPGVAVGVLEDGVERHEAYGVTSIENPLDVTPETRFQIGSITKTFLGTAVSELVARDEIELDKPVKEYVPELALADADATERVTMRHLLSHTAGWFGDYFDDTGWGDDAFAIYVERMRDLPQQTPVGELWAYNNAGFVLAGHAVERVTGKRVEDVIRELVCEPLELKSTTFWPWEVMTERYAVGHLGLGDELQVARPWQIGRYAAAAGGIASTTPDLLRYARLHLEPPPALAAMQEPQAPAADEGEWVGLTWYGEDRFGTLRHGGGTNGQIAMLLLVPARGYALALLTNHSPGGLQVMDAMFKAAGVAGEDPQPLEDVAMDEFAGVYETTLGRVTLTPLEGGRIRIESESFGGFPKKDSPPGPQLPPAEAFFYTPERWTIGEGPLVGSRGHFIRGEDGSVRWLRSGGRLYRRA
ncbi:MAG TPA: serine hydrolase domain-containing protein [Gaiellaceae bacterium]|nr:serine hydrolase domain-containing protein [Gaiellaceae bacterium]